TCPQVRQRRRLTQSLRPSRAQSSQAGSATAGQSVRTSAMCSHGVDTPARIRTMRAGPWHPGSRLALVAHSAEMTSEVALGDVAPAPAPGRPALRRAIVIGAPAAYLASLATLIVA